MNIFVKLGIIGAIIGGITYAVKSTRNISFQITGYGTPKVNLPVVTVPVQVQFNNPFPTSIPIDKFKADVSVLQSGSSFVHAGTISSQSAIVLKPGVNTLTLDTVISLQTVSKNIFQTAQTILSQKALTLRTDAVVTIKDYVITKSFTNTVSLNGKPSSIGLLPGADRPVRPMPVKLKNLVPPPTDKNLTVIESGADPIRDTVPLIKSKIKRTLYQTKSLAEKLKGATISETLKNDFNFVFDHIGYKEDAEGIEQVKSPRRLIYDGAGDCDDRPDLLLPFHFHKASFIHFPKCFSGKTQAST